MSKTNTRDARKRRHARVREKVSGTGDRPRLCVYRSLNNIYAQVIDDEQGSKPGVRDPAVSYYVTSGKPIWSVLNV